MIYEPGPGGCRRGGLGQGSQGRPCGLQGAAWQAQLAQDEGLQPTPLRPLPAARISGDPLAAEGQDSVCPSCRRLDAELNVAALLSVLVAPPAPRTLAECPAGVNEARVGGNSPAVP